MARAKQTTELDTAMVVERENEIARTVWTLLEKEAREPGSLEPSEREFLRRQFQLEKPDGSEVAFRQWLTGGVRQKENMLQLQHQAGTASERRAAVDRLAAARQARAERLPEVKAEIARLTQEEAALTNAVSQAEALIAQQEKACADLRSPKRLPPDARQRLAVHEMRTVKPRSELAAAEGRLRSIENTIALDPDISEHRNGPIYHYCHSVYLSDGLLSDRVFPRDPPKPFTVRLADFKPAEWAKHIVTLQVEAETLRSRITELTPIVEADEAEAVRLASVLIPQ